MLVNPLTKGSDRSGTDKQADDVADPETCAATSG
jgi:hypothetical protein